MEKNIEWAMSSFGMSEAQAKRFLEIEKKNSQDYINSLGKPKKHKEPLAIVTITVMSGEKKLSSHCSNEEKYRQKVIDDIMASGSENLSIFITRVVQAYLSYKDIWVGDGNIENVYEFRDITAGQAVLALNDLSLRIRLTRMSTVLSQRSFAKEFNIPYRSIENWETGQRVPPEYVVELIEYKIENEKQKMFSEK